MSKHQNYVHFLHKCACGVEDSRRTRLVRYAIVLQTGTLGGEWRERSRALTVYACPRCIRNIQNVQGKKLREALATAVQQQALELFKRDR